MLASYTYTAILVVGFCSSFAFSETKNQFISIPAAKQKISLSSNLTINCSTNDANASTAVYFKQRSRQKTWKLLKPGDNQIIQVTPQVYTLINATRQHKGQYQCRSWKGVNGTVISWPIHVGKVIVSKESVSKKPPGSKKQGKSSGLKKSKERQVKRKPVSKKNSKRRRIFLKKPSRKRLGKKRPGSKNNKRKRPGSKKGGKKRQGAKIFLKKKTASKRGKKKLLGIKKSWKKRPAGKKGGKKTKIPKKKIEKQIVKNKKQKSSIKLKTKQTNINATVGRNLYINCVAKYQPAKPRPSVTITWYKDGKLIGQPFPPHLTIATKAKISKRKIHSLLMITSFQTAHKGKYVCKAHYLNGKMADSLTIQVTPKS